MILNKTKNVCNYNFTMSLMDTMLELTEIIHFENNQDTTYEEIIKKNGKQYEWDYREL